MVNVMEQASERPPQDHANEAKSNALQHEAASELSSSQSVLANRSSGLEDLDKPKDFTAGRLSSTDPEGRNHDFRSIAPGQTLDLGTINGSGEIDHMWFTIAAQSPDYLRDLVVRAYWDGADKPAVECPLGDFFGLGFGKMVEYKSAPIAVGGSSALNCYWPMPFAKSAHLTITNEGTQNVGNCYYNIDYRLQNHPESKPPLYFHTQYHQAYPTPQGQDYTIADVNGKGQYVGTFLSVMANSDGWWGEGNDKFYVDGSTKPTIEGTGSEDYFNGAWDFGHPFTTDYFGVPYYDPGEKRGILNTAYRWHIPDPVPFTKSLHFDIEHGNQGGNDDRFPLRNNYSSVAYYYIDHPEQDGDPLPPHDDRIPQLLDPPQVKAKK